MRVKELSDEEISCIITGLARLKLDDEEYMYFDYIEDLKRRIEKNRIFIGDEVK